MKNSLLPILIYGLCSLNNGSTHFYFEKTPVKNPLFRITIDRKVSGDNCTHGYLLVNDSVMAYTLELSDKDNQNYISSIPKDIYNAKIRTDGPLGWRVELLDVPGRNNIEIHIGNYTRNITGCTLIGTKIDIDNCNVTNNYKAEAMKNLQALFNTFTTDLILNQGNTNPIDITVEVTGI